jgi:hypothetical protein
LGSINSNPLFTIWTRPRNTMRQVIEKKQIRTAILLSAIGGLSQLLLFLENFGDNVNISSSILLLSLPLGALGGIIYVYVFGALLKWSGKLIGGTGNYFEVRSALAWANVPIIASFLIEILNFIVFGHEKTPNGTPLIQSGSVYFIIFEVLFILLTVVIGVWGFIVTLKCIGEAHQFSAAKAFQCTLLPSLFLVVLLTLFFVIHGLTR